MFANLGILPVSLGERRLRLLRCRSSCVAASTVPERQRWARREKMANVASALCLCVSVCLCVCVLFGVDDDDDHEQRTLPPALAQNSSRKFAPTDDEDDGDFRKVPLPHETNQRERIESTLAQRESRNTHLHEREEIFCGGGGDGGWPVHIIRLHSTKSISSILLLAPKCTSTIETIYHIYDQSTRHI